MLKRINNNLFFAQYCEWVKDCSEREAAYQKYEAAKTARENAETQRDNLKAEMDNVQQMRSNYTEMYNTMSQLGSTVANPSYLGMDTGLGGAIKCLSDYGAAVENDYNEAVKSVQECLKAEEQALQTYNTTYCKHYKVCY